MPSEIIVRNRRIVSANFSDPNTNDEPLSGLIWENIPGAPLENPADGAVVEHPEGAMILITGANGSGKTRLFDAFHRKLISVMRISLELQSEVASSPI